MVKGVESFPNGFGDELDERLLVPQRKRLII
jgi:hypothetical protein